MKPSLEIDHGATQRAGCHAEPVAGAAWDDGERIATTEPEVYDDEPDTDRDSGEAEIVRAIFGALASTGDVAAIGRRVTVLAYLAGSLPDVQNDAQLADRLNISRGRVSQLRAEIKGVFPSLERCRSLRAKTTA